MTCFEYLASRFELSIKPLKWGLLAVLLICNRLIAQSNCIDLTDLSAPFIHCTYGSFWDPYSNQGVIPGRHTVLSQQDYDSITFGQLPMIPPGETYSVRLGNSSTGSEAESISVDITIDTNNFDLLILKYAAVLKDFGHAAVDQPRFKYEILDINNNAIDPNCFSMMFIASPSLGWHQAGIVLYKDWTHVGIDVTPFHNQTIRVRLTTFDCAEYRCFGYAYFLLTCGQKLITASGCGNSEYSYTAPDGFHYDWYWQDDPTHSISNNQTVTVPAGSSGELGCRVSFIGNPSCGFDLYTSTERRFPISAFNVFETDCSNKFDFINESFVSHDGTHPDGTGSQCDVVLWNFGDGQSSNDFFPTHSYSSPGNYTVSLVAALDEFECSDTSYYEVFVPENTLVDTFACETYYWEGVFYQESGEYQKVLTTELGCDSLVTLKLDVNYNPSFSILGEQWPIGGTELAWTQYTYNLVFDHQYCSVDSVRWSVDCPTMSVSPSDNGLSCDLSIFSHLPQNDSVPLRATAYNRCGTEERTLWIHTSYYGIDDRPLEAPSLSVFPNPTSATVTVAVTGLAGETLVELYNSAGTLVTARTVLITENRQHFDFDVSTLPDGLYTFRVSNNGMSLSHKAFVKK